MDKKYVSAVLLDDKWSQGNFRINPYTGYLQYKVADDLIETIDNEIDGRDVNVRCSDLLSELKSRNFNLLDSKGIDPQSNELGFISSYDENGNAEKVEVISSSISISDLNQLSTLQTDLMNMQIGYIPNTYLDDGTGDYSTPERYGLKENYYNFRLVRDLVTNSTVVNMMSMTDPIYTDTLDLNRVLHDNVEYDNVSIRLGVQYTTVEDIHLARIKEIIFPYQDDMQCELDNLVNIEYFDRCIKLFPSDDVNECIISYCHLLYE